MSAKSSGQLKNLLDRRIRWLMLFRLVMATFLLGTTFVVQFRGPASTYGLALPALYSLIGGIYFLTFIYATVLPRLFSGNVQAYIQIAGDVVITTGVIYLTGGLESTFSFMYILAVINAGIMLKTRGALITASLSAIVYGALLDLHFYNYISPYMTRFFFIEYFQAEDVLNTILVNMGAFYLAAFLVGYLARQAEESNIKLAESRSDLELLENLNENIVQSIDAGLMTLDSNGRVQTFNPAAERITGFVFSQIKNLHYSEVFPGLELPEHQSPEMEEIPIWSWPYKKRDGRELYLDLDLIKLNLGSDGEVGRLLVFHDRTQIHRMEEEVKRVEKLAAIGEMAAAIAHEIRNPLASMSGSFQMLERILQSDEDQTRLIVIIRREMERLKHIVNDFLLFARPRPAQPESLDLSGLLLDILAILEHQEDLDEGILIEKRVTPGLLAFFDQNQLEQIIWNLAQNAIVAMPNGGRLTVMAKPCEVEPELVTIMIADTGMGIPADTLPRIFDPFFTTKERGSGLGLSIVYRILEAGGGRIEVDSEPGEGAIFTVWIPGDNNFPAGLTGH